MIKGGCQELLHKSGKDVKEKANSGKKLTLSVVFVLIFYCLGRTETYS